MFSCCLPGGGAFSDQRRKLDDLATQRNGREYRSYLSPDGVFRWGSLRAFSGWAGYYRARRRVFLNVPSKTRGAALLRTLRSLCERARRKRHADGWIWSIPGHMFWTAPRPSPACQQISGGGRQDQGQGEEGRHRSGTATYVAGPRFPSSLGHMSREEAPQVNVVIGKSRCPCAVLFFGEVALQARLDLRVIECSRHRCRSRVRARRMLHAHRCETEARNSRQRQRGPECTDFWPEGASDSNPRREIFARLRYGNTIEPIDPKRTELCFNQPAPDAAFPHWAGRTDRTWKPLKRSSP